VTHHRLTHPAVTPQENRMTTPVAPQTPELAAPDAATAPAHAPRRPSYRDDDVAPAVWDTAREERLRLAPPAAAPIG